MPLLMIDSIVPFYSPEYVTKYSALRAAWGQGLVWTKEHMFLYTVSSSKRVHKIKPQVTKQCINE